MLQRAAAENDALLLSGGSSAGKADLTAEVIGELGGVYCHGVAVKPGKPTVIVGATDNISLGILRYLHERGIKVPQEQISKLIDLVMIYYFYRYSL